MRQPTDLRGRFASIDPTVSIVNASSTERSTTHPAIGRMRGAEPQDEFGGPGWAGTRGGVAVVN
jgi:hypothetical protein